MAGNRTRADRARDLLLGTICVGFVVAAVFAAVSNVRAGEAESHAARGDARASTAVSAAAANQRAIASANAQLRALGGTPVPTPAPVTGAAGRIGPTGLAGRGIERSYLAGGHLFLAYTDGARIDVGRVVGPHGSAGSSGAAGRPGAAGGDGKDGADGRGIAGVSIDGSGHLLVTYTDGATVDVGKVTGPAGADGANGANGADGADGASGQPGKPPASFTFDVLGVTYDCTPDGSAGPGDQPRYSCQPTGAAPSPAAS